MRIKSVAIGLCLAVAAATLAHALATPGQGRLRDAVRVDREACAARSGFERAPSPANEAQFAACMEGRGWAYHLSAR